MTFLYPFTSDLRYKVLHIIILEFHNISFEFKRDEIITIVFFFKRKNQNIFDLFTRVILFLFSIL